MGYFPIFPPVVGYKKFMRCIKWTGILIDAAVIYGELRYIWTSQTIIMFDIEIIYTYIHLAQNNVWNRNPNPYLGVFSTFQFGFAWNSSVSEIFFYGKEVNSWGKELSSSSGWIDHNTVFYTTQQYYISIVLIILPLWYVIIWIWPQNVTSIFIIMW